MINNIQLYRPGVGYLPVSTSPLKVAHGDKLRVMSTFKYRKHEQFTCRVIAYVGTQTSKGLTSAMSYTLPATPVGQFLEASSVNTIDIVEKGIIGGGLTQGVVYNLGVEIPQGDVHVELPHRIEMTKQAGMLDTLGSMLPMIMIMMMMGMMMNVMDED